jgi:hypothetical protein
MGKLLWQPSEEVKQKANMTRFIRFVNEKLGLDINAYDEVVDDFTRFPRARLTGY